MSWRSPRCPVARTSGLVVHAVVAERLQKVLAAAGIASRREAERWIGAGRLSIDGHRAELGDTVAHNSVVRLDGKTLDVAVRAAHEYMMYHKPPGEVCTRSDERGRPTVFDNLPTTEAGRWVAVGRLDLNTSGLLLFCTDGALANRLMHPSAELARRYAVRVHGNPTEHDIEKLLSGVMLDDGPARFTAVTRKGAGKTNTWFEAHLREGRYREVRRLWESVGYPVSRLMRVGYGPLALPSSLDPGVWRHLNDSEIAQLKRVKPKKKQ